MESGPAFWLLLVNVGVVVLAIAMGYGILRNRSQIPAAKAQTEAAMKREYERENRDES